MYQLYNLRGVYLNFIYIALISYFGIWGLLLLELFYDPSALKSIFIYFYYLYRIFWYTKTTID